MNLAVTQPRLAPQRWRARNSAFKMRNHPLLAEVFKTPDFRRSRLSTLDYRGLTLDDLLDAPAQYERFTA